MLLHLLNILIQITTPERFCFLPYVGGGNLRKGLEEASVMTDLFI